MATAADTTVTSRRRFLSTAPFAAVAAGTVTTIYSDLASACLGETARRQWLDQARNTEGMSEEDWSIEFCRSKAIWERAITERSASPHDMAAKASLLLDVFDRFSPAERYDTDDLRLLRTLLREIIEASG